MLSSARCSHLSGMPEIRVWSVRRMDSWTARYLRVDLVPLPRFPLNIWDLANRYMVHSTGFCVLANRYMVHYPIVCDPMALKLTLVSDANMFLDEMVEAAVYANKGARTTSKSGLEHWTDESAVNLCFGLFRVW